jgi:uncharacterized protein YkwD
MYAQTTSTTKRKTTKRNASQRLESLETRSLLSAAYPTAVEQYVVELINRARANPSAEAARFDIDLNEGLKSGTISPGAKQPLALNPYLVDASRGHSQWMIDTDTFSHAGANGSTPGDRMKAAGYAFASPWAWSSNIALRSFKTGAPHNDVFEAIHKDLFVDLAIPDRGHRVNMLAANMKEVGVGGVYGQYSYWTAEAVTESFAQSGNNTFLTGVVFTDAVAKDKFYTPGEGLGGVTLTAVRAGDGATFTTQTWSAGGYSLKLAPGTYKVTASGGGLGSPISYGAVTVGDQNVKRDFTPSSPSAPTPTPPPPPPTPTPEPSAGAPAAPTGLVATPVSAKSVLIQWTDNASNETSYKVERSTDGRTFYPLLGGGVNSVRALDTGASAGKRYYYRVYATNAAGKSTYSNVADAVPSTGTTPAPPPPPPPPPPRDAAPDAPAPHAPAGHAAPGHRRPRRADEPGRPQEHERRPGAGAHVDRQLEQRDPVPGRAVDRRQELLPPAGRQGHVQPRHQPDPGQALLLPRLRRQRVGQLDVQRGREHGGVGPTVRDFRRGHAKVSRTAGPTRRPARCQNNRPCSASPTP